MAPDDEDLGSLFQEPEGYFEPEKPATSAEYILHSGETLRLRLVGHDPLWVFHRLTTISGLNY